MRKPARRNLANHTGPGLRPPSQLDARGSKPGPAPLQVWAQVKSPSPPQLSDHHKGETRAGTKGRRPGEEIKIFRL